MKKPLVVSREEWFVARKEHLAKEKELTRLRDQLSQERRDLPWVKVEKEYVFDGPNGREALSDLFEGRSQLLVYHFMFDPSWSEGCKSCSFWADNYSNIIVHLNHRDVTMVTISKAPLDILEAYKKRMGWKFKWYPRSIPISTVTIMCPSRRRSDRRERCITIMGCPSSSHRRARGSASSTKMRTRISSIPIHATLAG